MVMIVAADIGCVLNGGYGGGETVIYGDGSG